MKCLNRALSHKLMSNLQYITMTCETFFKFDNGLFQREFSVDLSGISMGELSIEADYLCVTHSVKTVTKTMSFPNLTCDVKNMALPHGFQTLFQLGTLLQIFYDYKQKWPI